MIPANGQTATAASSRSFRNLLTLTGSYLLNFRPVFLLMLIALLSAFMTFYSENFLTYSNLSAVLLNAAQNGILVVGMTILMIGGVFDLSIGSTLALTGVLTGVLIAQYGLPVWLGAAIGLVTGAVCGLMNGLIVTKQKINALIATLATMSIYRGITQLISGTGVAPIDSTFAKIGQTVLLGFQTPFWFMLVVVVLLSFAVSKSRFFRKFYYVGGNERAAKLSGINAERVILAGFILMGILAGLAGVLGAARLNAAVVSAGIGVELQIITAAVLGGASLKGGEGTVVGAFLGVLFIALMQNAMIIMKLSVFWQNIVLGLVLLFAVSLDRWKQKTRT
jgi:ribose/xylose/arabinose/galactoside ABC-type transport system permease subunit